MSSSGSSSRHPPPDKSKGKSKYKPQDKPKDKSKDKPRSSSKDKPRSSSKDKPRSSKGGISAERLQAKIKGLTPVPDGGGMRRRKNGRLESDYRSAEYFEKNPERITDGLHPRVMKLPFKLPRHPNDGASKHFDVAPPDQVTRPK